MTLKLAALLKAAGSSIRANTLDPGTVNTKMLLAGWGRIGIEVHDADNTYELLTDSRIAATGINFLTGTKVVEANLAAKTLKTASGDTLTYDKLVISTGAEPVMLSDHGIPGADLPGIFYLRNLADADRLVSGITDAKAAGGKAVVVGGGYIGLEVAAGLRLNNLDVTMVFPEPHLMARLLTPELAAFYEAYYQAKGIKLIKGRLTKAFQAAGKGSLTPAGSFTTCMGGQEVAHVIQGASRVHRRQQS
eukprot:gene8424-8607_t